MSEGSGLSRLNLNADELLSTTRAVRKRLDFEKPVDMKLVSECVELALQAPTGSNEQGWHFVVVQDQGKREQIADLYRRAWKGYRTSDGFSAFRVHADDDTMRPVQERMVSSVEYLAENLEHVPVFVIPCVAGRVEAVPGPFAVVTQASTYGSIVPAAWSFMLAARERGLGTAWTTLHLFFEREVAEILDIPYAEMTQIALIPVAHTLGTDFKPGPRIPMDRVLHVDGW